MHTAVLRKLQENLLSFLHDLHASGQVFYFLITKRPPRREAFSNMMCFLGLTLPFQELALLQKLALLLRELALLFRELVPLLRELLLQEPVFSFCGISA